MAKKRESRRQLKIRKALEREFVGYWKKIHGGPFQDAGMPDLIGCVGGLYFGFEVKEPDGTPTELQLENLRQITEAGGVGEIVETPQEAIHFVRAALTKAGRRRRVYPETEDGRSLP